MQTFSPKDFSIVIVTYNRHNEIKRNFEHIYKLNSYPKEIIVIDQSENDLTKKICSNFSKKLKIIKYFHSSKPSIPRAKNLGVKKSSSKSKVILFLDDDAFVEPTYLDEMCYWYNSIPEANGVFGFDYYKFGGKKIVTSIEKLKFFLGKNIRRAFLLGHVGAPYFSITSPYGANSTLEINYPVRADWFPGTNPSFKKKILKEFKFDENFFWWALGEDVDISYRINKKYGNLFIVPASIFHQHPPHEDDEKRKIRKIYMNQINHFYLFYKLMPEMKIRFFWNLIGITLLRTIALLQVTKIRKRFIEWKFFLKSLIYSVRNTSKIKKGDLSIPYN